MKYRRAPFKDVKRQVIPLARKSFQEVDSRVKNAFDINVNEDLYEAMEAGGNYAMFVAEDEGGIIHGYLGVVISESPHIMGYVQAVQDSMYVEKSFRQAMLVKGLIAAAEDYANEIKCSSITIGFKAERPHTKFANSMGYDSGDVMHTKILEGV